MHQRSALLLVCVSTLVPLTFAQPAALAEPAPVTTNEVQKNTGLLLLYADTDVFAGQKAGYTLQFNGPDGKRADRVHGTVTVTIDGEKTTNSARFNQGFAFLKTVTWNAPSDKPHTLVFTATADDGTVLGTVQATTRVHPAPKPEPDSSTSSLLSSGISFTPGDAEPDTIPEYTKYYLNYGKELEAKLNTVGNK